MSKRAFAIRMLSIAAGLVLIGGSTAGATAPTGDDGVAGGPPTPGGAVFLATDMLGTNAPPADLDGTGRAIIRIQGLQVCYLLQWNGILAPFVGHIHDGVAGVNGPVVVGFFNGQLPANITGVTGCNTTTAENIARILADPSAFYANVHNSDFPGGAIRGQLRRLNRGVDFNQVLKQPFLGLMDGMQEVVGAGDQDGRGVSFVRLGATTVTFSVSWSGIAAPTAGHIHIGGTAQAGAVVVPFFAAPMGLPAALNGVSGVATADAALIRDIRRHPADYYTNLHNAEFPGGAIRGQLMRIGASTEG
jgi:hypothetical protein